MNFGSHIEEAARNVVINETVTCKLRYIDDTSLFENDRNRYISQNASKTSPVPLSLCPMYFSLVDRESPNNFTIDDEQTTRRTELEKLKNLKQK